MAYRGSCWNLFTSAYYNSKRRPLQLTEHLVCVTCYSRMDTLEKLKMHIQVKNAFGTNILFHLWGLQLRIKARSAKRSTRRVQL